jgi:hypothetical protein
MSKAATEGAVTGEVHNRHSMRPHILVSASFCATLVTAVAINLLVDSLFRSTRLTYSPQDGLGSLLYDGMPENVCCFFIILQGVAGLVAFALLGWSRSASFGLLASIPVSVVALFLFGVQLASIANQIVPRWFYE